MDIMVQKCPYSLALKLMTGLKSGSEVDGAIKMAGKSYGHAILIIMRYDLMANIPYFFIKNTKDEAWGSIARVWSACSKSTGLHILFGTEECKAS